MTTNAASTPTTAATTNAAADPVDQVLALLNTLTLTDAELVRLSEVIGDRAGVVAVAYCRSDVEETFREETGEQLTDEQWYAVRDTPAFQKLYDTVTDAARDALTEAFREAGLT